MGVNTFPFCARGSGPGAASCTPAPCTPAPWFVSTRALGQVPGGDGPGSKDTQTLGHTSDLSPERTVLLFVLGGGEDPPLQVSVWGFSREGTPGPATVPCGLPAPSLPGAAAPP